MNVERRVSASKRWYSKLEPTVCSQFLFHFWTFMQSHLQCNWDMTAGHECKPADKKKKREGQRKRATSADDQVGRIDR